MKGGKHQKKKKEKLNGTTVYVGSSQTVYNPLLFVHKLRWNKVTRRFLFLSKIKMLGMLLNVVHRQIHKNI